MKKNVNKKIKFFWKKPKKLIILWYIYTFYAIFIAFFIWNRIEEKKAEKVAWEEWHKQKEEEAKLKAEMNFFENRIAEDMLHIGSKINTRLVELYKGE